MRRFYSVVIAGAALFALAAAAFFKMGQSSVNPLTPGASATSSISSASSLSPDSQVSQLATSSAPAFNLNAKAAAAANLISGDILYGFNADMRWPIASLTKIMTAQIVLDHMDPADTIVLAPEDFTFGTSGLTVNLEPGDRYSVADLLKILLLPSSNEAAQAFARTYGRAGFISAMNAKAASWGLQSTHFADPSGVSVANQSTPRDFMILARNVYALRPEIFTMTRARSVLVQELGTGAFKEFVTTNNFAGRADFLGGKTGTTPEAGDNLISVFERNGSPVAILVLGAAERYIATESLLQLMQ